MLVSCIFKVNMQHPTHSILSTISSSFYWGLN